MKSIYFLVTTIIIFTILLFSCKSTASRSFDYSWLEGSWIGDGFEGTSEEVWSAPSKDGTMMGVYRHHKSDGSLNFYEFLTLDTNGIRIKHFSPELKGWEEKEDYITFEMIEYDLSTIKLKGLIFEYSPPEKMMISLKMKDSKGYSTTQVFNMTRKK